MPIAAQFDCMRCGACCVNPSANRATCYVDYVEVCKSDPIHKKPELVRRFVVRNERDELHMRLDAGGRCVALRGRIGQRVSCYIYEARPAACRRVEAGTAACRAARAEHAIDEDAPRAANRAPAASGARARQNQPTSTSACAPKNVGPQAPTSIPANCTATRSNAAPAMVAAPTPSQEATASRASIRA